MEVSLSRAADESCMASARRWRTEAEVLRDHATASYLTPSQSASLRREAETADRQAQWWLSALERH
ncbi:hypothetical protein HN018_24250 (plasmid) [Lichenicola cladoniae]|uniref:Uncharacterized protein n=1 Tax=Lichenicola cladoniae TaxID=1484109 RepID=A0A6M8HXN8_9PROT|nr:hypothetical protein [Lichenicola cladoniae]NPD70276.1 hypothetical protein [Acetobacteraceae bacterium]QKE93324.1 hypothetical protein HN018_24250 [Lichenicola cladoniae]